LISEEKWEWSIKNERGALKSYKDECGAEETERFFGP
jgi:hypothetical protein